MKVLMSIVLAAIIINQVAISPIDGLPVENSTEIAAPPATVNMLTVFQVIRSVIHALLQSMQLGASSTGQNIQDMLNSIRDQKFANINELNSTLEQMTNDAEAAYQVLATTAEIFVITATECANQYNMIIERILINASSSLGECFMEVETDIGTSVGSIWNVIQAIVYMGVDLANQITTCGVASFGDLLATGTCLGEVLSLGQAMANTNFVQLATAVADIFTSITSAPTNLAVCLGSHLASNALEGAKIIVDITKCTVSAVASMEE